MDSFQKTTIGKCLTESLDEMVKNGTLHPELAIQVLLQFNKSMTEAVKIHAKHTFSIKGHIHWYNFHDHVWTFVLHDALIKSKTLLDGEIGDEKIDRLKIVAMDSAALPQYQ